MGDDEEWEDDDHAASDMDDDAPLYGADPYEYCIHCNGTSISPYPGDGGSCPHCILGRVRRSENFL